MAPSRVRVEFCGEWFDVDPLESFTIGREGSLAIDDNPYLHRRFLAITHRDGIWWMVNLGRQIAATVSDHGGMFQAWLAPGAHLPIVFESLTVRFTAGPTAYAMTIHLSPAPFVANDLGTVEAASTTLGGVVLEGEHLLLVLALAEPLLRDPGGGRVAVPTSAAAAARLGWPVTKFNRKLDHICQRLKKVGVQGLHGDVAALAADRKARLVEYALATRSITKDDLVALDAYGVKAPLSAGSAKAGSTGS